LLNILFLSISIFFIKNLKFRGKGYYVFKTKKNILATQFGKSHKINLFYKFINLKMLLKTSLVFYSINLKDLNFASFIFFNIKPINIFTGRGIRFYKQIIYKKKGKVSSYR
jgi:ribosomal protein L6P/L9E